MLTGSEYIVSWHIDRKLHRGKELIMKAGGRDQVFVLEYKQKKSGTGTVQYGLGK